MAQRRSRTLILLFALLAPFTRAADPATVRVSEARQHGELPYRFYLDAQRYLQARLPAEPRLIDLRMRAHYQDKSDAEADDYDPHGWGVSILSESVDAAVPMQRGGYFVLPELSQAYDENGVILFRDANQRHFMRVALALRLPADQRMPYAALDQALQQARAVVGKISFFKQDMRELKHTHYSGIKACFLDPDGAILVDGKPMADGASGDCKVLTIDPARAAGAGVVEFSRTVNIVTFVDTRQLQP